MKINFQRLLCFLGFHKGVTVGRVFWCRHCGFAERR